MNFTKKLKLTQEARNQHASARECSDLLVDICRVAWDLEIEKILSMPRYRLETGKRKGDVLRNISAFEPKEHGSCNTSSVN